MNETIEEEYRKLREENIRSRKDKRSDLTTPYVYKFSKAERFDG